MTVMCGLLGFSPPNLSKVALSPIEVKIWWLGAIGFLLDVREFLGQMIHLLSCPIEVDLFPIEVGRSYEKAFRVKLLLELLDEATYHYFLVGLHGDGCLDTPMEEFVS
ncbi:hypothetical protein SUGI_1007240 [Cryptomeria japonica]|nr:hypothetical protein SUGI_1007240 [Cryptomeria japonica]